MFDATVCPSDKSARFQVIIVLCFLLKKNSRHVSNSRFDCYLNSHCGSVKLQEPDCVIRDVIG